VIRHYQVVFRTPRQIWPDLILVLEVNNLPNCVVFGIKITELEFLTLPRAAIMEVDSLEKPQTIMFA
jgi:hypothetical protein